MRSFVYRLADRLRAKGGGLSRNRHFQLFSTPDGTRARRVVGRIQALEQLLDRHAEAVVEVRALPHGVAIRIHVEALKLEQATELSTEDVALAVGTGTGRLAALLAPFAKVG